MYSHPYCLCPDSSRVRACVRLRQGKGPHAPADQRVSCIPFLPFCPCRRIASSPKCWVWYGNGSSPASAPANSPLLQRILKNVPSPAPPNSSEYTGMYIPARLLLYNPRAAFPLPSNRNSFDTGLIFCLGKLSGHFPPSCFPSDKIMQYFSCPPVFSLCLPEAGYVHVTYQTPASFNVLNFRILFGITLFSNDFYSSRYTI